MIQVNEALAHRHFGDADPVEKGLVVRFGDRPGPREIVGVVGDTRPLGHASEPRLRSTLLSPLAGRDRLPDIRRARHGRRRSPHPTRDEGDLGGEPSRAIWGAAPVEELVADWPKERRFGPFLITTVSGIALALSAIGLYGLVSFRVDRRLGELRIRRALGGQARDLRRTRRPFRSIDAPHKIGGP